jgi:hypothetical protein
MNIPIQCGRSYREWWFLALILAAVSLLGGGLMLLAVKQPFAASVLIVGGVAAFSVLMSALLIARSRFQVEITPGGFRVRDRRGEREFSDDRVICASLSNRSNYTNGLLQSTTRTFDVWVEGESGSERIKIANRIGLGASDPLMPLVERVHAHLYERAHSALAAGQPFDGEDWTLHADELIVNTRRNARSVRFEDLAAAEIFDGRLCVWKHGQDEPVLRIPISSANTHVLLQLLRERIAASSANGEPRSGDELGRILFERKPDSGMVWLMWLAPPAFAVALAITIFLGAFRGDRGAGGVGLAICFVIAGLWGLSLTQSIAFRVHEQGVRRKWLFGTQQLKYADVDTFTYSAVRQFVKGVYAGTNFTLTFTSRTNGKSRKLTYARKLRNADADLDHLRDSVSRLIANRMAAEFGQGRSVVWTDGLRFLPEGIEYRASGFFGRKPPIVLPYSQILGHDANQGTFWLWIQGKKKPVVKENMAQPNFFPGYMFLTRLLAARSFAAPTNEQASMR